MLMKTPSPVLHGSLWVPHAHLINVYPCEVNKIECDLEKPFSALIEDCACGENVHLDITEEHFPINRNARRADAIVLVATGCVSDRGIVDAIFDEQNLLGADMLHFCAYVASWVDTQDIRIVTLGASWLHGCIPLSPLFCIEKGKRRLGLVRTDRAYPSSMEFLGIRPEVVCQCQT